MSTLEEHRTTIRGFGAHYDYNVSYLEHLMDASMPAYEAFAAAMGTSSFRLQLDRDAHFVGRIAAMRADDCGACTQLSVNMALEAGVPPELLRTLLDEPEQLSPVLLDVYTHAVAVVTDQPNDQERMGRLRKELGEDAVCELAVSIAGGRIYPTLKRALGMHTACAIVGVPNA